MECMKQDGRKYDYFQ